MSGKILKAGVIGGGVFGGHHAHKYQADPRVELVGVYDLDAERTEALAETLGVRAFDNMDNMLDLLDIVTIACPPVTHASAAAAALEYGKHVLIEKPITTSVSEAELLIMVADLQKVVLACGHQERLVFEAMGLFAASEKPLRIESVREGPWTGRSADVSVTLDLMVHDMDLALALMGEQPEAIKAQGGCKHGVSADWLDAELTFGNGAVAHFEASRVAEARMRTMRIVYPSGEVKIDFLARTFENSSKVALNANFAQTPAGRDPLGANVARFIDAVLGAAPRPAVTGTEAAAALKLGLDTDKAAGLPSLSV
jgi:predicted dehydrogenase